MINIHIKNSFSQLLNVDSKTISLVRTTLTYQDDEVAKEIVNLFMQIKIAQRKKLSYKIEFFRKKIEILKQQETVCLLDQENYFPTGLLFMVEEVLKNNKSKFEILDLRKKPKKSINYQWYSDLNLRYYQKESIDLGLKYGRGVFELSIGSGKTLVMQQLVKELGVKALIIVPAKNLKHQLMESFKDAFGSKQVMEITSDSVKTKKPIKNIRFATVQTLASLQKQGLLEAVIWDIDFIGIDEAHHSGADTYLNLLPYFDHVYYKFSFSGTYLRNDSKTMSLLGFCSNILYRYSPAKATSDGYLTPLEITVHEVEGKHARNYNTEYTQNYCKNIELLLKIKEIFEYQIAKDEQVLILVKQKDASGKIIHEYLEELGIKNTFISGDDKQKDVKNAIDNFNNREIQVLIGSSVLGEGIDIKSTDHLIMCQGGKSEIAIVQALGRAVRLYPGKKIAKVHDFLFLNTKYLSDHLCERLRIYEKNFEPKKIEII
jgi:superfamily II DNA or RNA helicase